MLKRNIYIPIEFENRELVSQLLLSIFAAKKGFRVYIGNFACILKLLEKKKDRSGIFIVKGGLNIKLTNFVKRKCEHYLVMDQEISPGFKNSYYINLTSNRFLEPTVKEIDQYYCLNDYILKAVKKNKIFTKYKIKSFKTGWPRVDTWLPIMKKFYEEKASKIKKKHKDFILFCSDFSVTSRDDFEEYSSDIPWGAQRKEVHKIKKKKLKEAKLLFQEYKKFINFLKVVDKNSKCPKILVRSHPGESLKGWRNDLKKLKNVIHLEPKDQIDPYIYACNGFMHRGSTTAYQAILAKKATSYLNLNKDIKKFEAHYKPSLMKIAKKISNPQDLISWADDINYRKLKFTNYIKSNIIKKELNISKNLSSKKIIDKISSLKCKKDPDFKKYFPENSNTSLNILKNIVSKFIWKRKKNFNINKIKKFQTGVKKSEVKKIIKKIDKIYKINFFKEIDIKQISDNLVKIQ